MGRAQENDDRDHDDSRHGQPDREAAAVFWPEKIDDADGENQTDRRNRRVLARHAEVAHRRPSAQRGRNREIRDEQERPGGSKKSALFSCRGINAAAIREMRANNNIVVGHHRGEHADREDDRQGAEARRDKSQADDVGFARSPIAVKQRCRAFPIHVARARDCGGIEDRSGHRSFEWANVATV